MGSENHKLTESEVRQKYTMQMEYTSKGRKVVTDYLKVPGRVLLFRIDHPKGCIDTELLRIDEQAAMFKARIIDSDGCLLATGHARATFANSERFSGRALEKAETSAIGRALAAAGYGTDEAGEDLDEDDQLSDTPVERHSEDKPAKSTTVDNSLNNPSGQRMGGNGHKATDDKAAGAWYEAQSNLNTLSNLLATWELTIEDAEKLIGKHMKDFASGQEFAAAVKAKWMEGQPPAKPKNGAKGAEKPDDRPWYRTGEKLALTTWTSDYFDDTPDGLLKKMGLADLSSFPTLAQAKSEILKAAIKGLWPCLCTKATYKAKTDDSAPETYLHTVYGRLRLFDNRHGLIAKVGRSATVDWSVILIDWEGGGDFDLPEPIRITPKVDGDFLGIDTIHCVATVPF